MGGGQWLNVLCTTPGCEFKIHTESGSCVFNYNDQFNYDVCNNNYVQYNVFMLGTTFLKLYLLYYSCIGVNQ